MTDDQLWRIVIGSATLAVVGAFKPQIMRWMHKIGYRDWREKPAAAKGQAIVRNERRN